MVNKNRSAHRLCFCTLCSADTMNYKTHKNVTWVGLNFSKHLSIPWLVSLWNANGINVWNHETLLLLLKTRQLRGFLWLNANIPELYIDVQSISLRFFACFNSSIILNRIVPLSRLYLSPPRNVHVKIPLQRLCLPPRPTRCCRRRRRHHCRRRRCHRGRDIFQGHETRRVRSIFFYICL